MDAEVHLTEREQEVALLLAQGYGYKQVARMLGVSLHTVDNHVRNLADKIPGRGRPTIRIIRYICLTAPSSQVTPAA